MQISSPCHTSATLAITLPTTLPLLCVTDSMAQVPLSLNPLTLNSAACVASAQPSAAADAQLAIPQRLGTVAIQLHALSRRLRAHIPTRPRHTASQAVPSTLNPRLHNTTTARTVKQFADRAATQPPLTLFSTVVQLVLAHLYVSIGRLWTTESTMGRFSTHNQHAANLYCCGPQNSIWGVLLTSPSARVHRNQLRTLL